jgi:imidazolonepropionase-like amidohydrolase
MRYVLRGVALTDARSDELVFDQAVVVDQGTIRWIGDDAVAEIPSDTETIDASGSTLVPSLVDSHSHVTLPGGAHWIDHIADPPPTLLDVAERNGDRLIAGGVRWARDVGSPRVVDPTTGDERALAIGVRDRWHGHRDRPYIRAGGTWIARSGTLDGMVEADDGDALVEAVARQLDEGADLVKLYLDGPDPDTAPFTAGEVARAVAAASERGATVAAHATRLDGTRNGVAGGVTSIEHGVEIDADLAALMARNGTFLVTTHSVWNSWETFGTTTQLDRFVAGAERITERKEAAYESTRVARIAGVAIAGGSDFGGGSVRAGHLAWEVESLVECGLEPWEALAAVTWRGGDLLREPGAGRIGLDGPSDFFLVHGNPLDDPGALWRVWWSG